MKLSSLWLGVFTRMTPNKWTLVTFVAVTAIGLYIGLTDIPKSTFASSSHLYFNFFNGLDRLYLPVVAAIIGGYFFSAECTNRYIANTRSRADIRKHILRLAIQAMLRVFIGYAFVAVCYGVVAYALVPILFPTAVDSAALGTTDPTRILSWDMDLAPLSYFNQFGWPVHVFVSAVWAGLQAAMFALVAIVAVFLIRKPIVSLSVPFLIVLLESAVTQLLGAPEFSFLIISPLPGGLNKMSMLPPTFTSLALLIPTLMAFVILLLRSAKSPRFS